jgi:hypothetical protein
MFMMSAFVMRASGVERVDQKIAMLISVVGFICFGHIILNEFVIFYANSYLDLDVTYILTDHKNVTAASTITTNQTIS